MERVAEALRGVTAETGDRRPPSMLGVVQPDHWLAEYTTEPINLLNVLGRLVEIEPAQAALLERVCSAETISTDELREARALAEVADSARGNTVSDSSGQASLLGS